MRTMFALLTSAALALAAPSPLPRPARTITEADLAGTWLLGFEGRPGQPVTLAPGGGYDAWWEGTGWIGRWQLREGRLEVRERRISDVEDEPRLWLSASLRRVPGGFAGCAASGSTLRLERPR